MKQNDIELTLITLQKMATDCSAEINISPEGISLWTSDASDFQCQDVSADEAIKALKAIKRFRKYWKIKL